MKRAGATFVLFLVNLSSVWSQTAVEAAPPADAAAAKTTQAAAIVGSKDASVRVPDFLEHLVDSLLGLFDVRSAGNTWQHYAIAATLLVGFYLLRHAVTHWIFGFLKKLASKTKTTFDDKLFPALEGPVSTFIALLGVFAALKVLKLSESSDGILRVAMTVAFSLCFFWALLRALSAFLDHLSEIARARQSGVAAFMPCSPARAWRLRPARAGRPWRRSASCRAIDGAGCRPPP